MLQRSLYLLLALLAACDDGGSTLADAEVEDATRADMILDAAIEPDAVADAMIDAAPPPIDRLALNEIRCGADARVEVIALDEQAALDGWRLRAGPREVALSGFAMPFASAEITAHCGVSRVELIDPLGEVVDSRVPQLTYAAASEGRLPDGVGEWATNRPTPDAPNAAWAVAADLFDGLMVHSLRIDLEDDAALALRREATREVDARFVINGRAPVDARVRVFGVDGRRRRYDQKSGWRVRADLPALGGMEIDAGLRDPAVLTRWLASRMLAQAGVRVPRVGFAVLSVAGKPLGLHLFEEPLLIPVLDQWFSSTWHSYRATRRDLVMDDLDAFNLLDGESGDRRDLRFAIEQLVDTEEATAFERATAVLDWTDITRTLAAEAWLGSVEGYGPSRQLIRLHFDQNGQMRLIPDGLDQTLRRRLSPYTGAGRLHAVCRGSLDCRALYDAAVVEVTEALAEVDWVAELTTAATILRPFVVADPQSFWTPGDFDREVARIAAFLMERTAEMGALAACLRTDTDPDGDGVRCAADCAPDDPAIHAGAVDVCNNDIDEDCSGVADDGANCPNCVSLSRSAAQYLVCARRATYAAGEAVCESLGAHPVKIDSLAENDWLHHNARRISAQDFWIGLTDREAEGTFVWYDGTTDEAFSNWGGGEPNDFGSGEDCTHFRGDRLWNDANCDGRRGIICEFECEPVDADGDGADGCTADCDDSDPERHPGAEDTCNDGLDQDCDGTADEGCGCLELTRYGRPYRFCAGGFSYDAALDECASVGMGLIEIDSPGENDWAYTVGRANTIQRWWIGLTDRAEEGAYRTADWRRPNYGAWSRGEPNDGGFNEDCVHLWEDRAQWNDARCGSEHGFICEAPCDPATDADGDGASGCGEDCDDGDPNRAPGLPEACNGVDDDCDARVDEGC